MIERNGTGRRRWLATASVIGLIAAAGTAAAEVPNDNFSPNAPPVLADPDAINGIGNIIVDTGGGSVGVCTGSLINPRTVLFAAHCVNDLPDVAYGSQGQGRPISIGFKGDAFDGILNWITSGDYATSYIDQHYNMSRVFYDPRSLEDAQGGGFYEGDVAIGVLDSPAKGVPTWAMLFSPLTGDEDRHVITGGYGRSGTGSLGSVQGIDFRRRAAENMIGALTSLDDINLFLFGDGAQGGLSQNLYMVDFDDPAGTATFDFNIFGDDVALENEGMTAGGDSGGPLILDRAFDTPVVVGVLSLGSRYFNGQGAASYGTTAGYQPLYLFTDWIVANNPYKYVTTTGGNGDWFDPTHWVQMMDPNYKIIDANGNLVTGLPATPAEGVDSRGGEWGSICFFGDCADAGQLADYNHDREDGLSGGAQPVKAEVTGGRTIVDMSGIVAGGAGGAGGAAGSSRGQTASGLAVRHEASAVGAAPGATLPFEIVPGGPGSTNFVPFNVQGDVLAGEKPLFYDVNLMSAGTTTLNAPAVIDRLTIGTSGAVLDIGADGLLFAQNDVGVWAGQLNVDGALLTFEMLLAGGVLSGSGVVDSTVLTSAMGSIAPGGQGEIGELTLLSDLVLASGSRLFIDIGGDQSDRLTVLADSFEGTAGIASLGGLLGLNFISAPKFGQTYTVLTAQGAIDGEFDAVTDISGVLYPVLDYTTTSVEVEIEAASYLDFINPNSRAQRTVGGMLDAARATDYAALGDIYAQTDLLEGEALEAGLESLSPFAAHSGVTLLSAQTEALRGVVDGRIARDRSGGASEGLTLIGSGVEVASLDPAATAAAAGMATRQAQERARWGGWKQGVSAYFGAGAIEGEAGQLRGTLADSRSDDQSAWYVVGGLERTIDALTVGASLAYAEGESDFAEGISTADSRQVQATLYGAVDLAYGAYLGAKVGYGAADLDTERAFAIGGASFRADGETDGKVVSGGAELGFNLTRGGLKLQPNIGLNAYSVDLDAYQETGGVAALSVADQSFDSLQHHIGLRVGGETSRGRWSIKPALDVRWVHELAGDNRNVEAAFVAADGFGGVFAGASNDSEWAEIGGSVAIEGDRFGVTLKAASMVDREDLDYQTYNATVTMKF
ncbi:MAG: autotransporter domain-containing protein [Phenylobacterium sp.]|jgi:subtilase-type serine protease|uniref:Autotransporter domain-containing protein n=1 Tax=Brevundimonas mediterranea TaxID=74329 RepID=A0AB37E5M8_9CAUL|nr:MULTISPECIES: autotransporter domain-containing protein [Brevundimonas]EDX80446.1 Autotransporter beta-domain protein [Brevundimonas sp. BAL3]MBA4333042.1 autotransporter domain-containing protein [Brevundimonas sp.]MDZ4376130.1 autotransporter domain-containing protein [Phenylobacterium sp.]QIH72429.1 autotransporter domain-containing protein [Brevundimonas mediterranea]